MTYHEWLEYADYVLGLKWNGEAYVPADEIPEGGEEDGPQS